MPNSIRKTVSPCREACRWIGFYTGLFLLASCAAYGLMWVQGESFLREGDAISQHFPALYHYNVIIRGFLRNPAAGIELWTHNAGLGADTIATFSYYVLGDPFALLSLLFPMENLGVAYRVLYLVRMYAVGLAALFFFRKLGANLPGSLAGTLIYTFSTFSLYAGERHPMFLVPAMMLPLLLIGVERALCDRRYGFLAVTAGLAALSNFYFFYILTIFVVLYALFRSIERRRKGEGTKFLPTVLRVGGAYLVGVLMACVILLPVLHATLSGTRLDLPQTLEPLYSWRRYALMIQSLFSFRQGGASTSGGFTLIALMLVATYFIRRRGFTALKAITITIFVFMLFPVFGLALNVFMFPSNRFFFVMGLFVGAIAALVLTDAQPFSKRELLWMLPVLVLATALSIPPQLYPGGWSYRLAVWAQIVLGWVFWAYLWFGRAKLRKGSAKAKVLGPKAVSYVFIGLVLCSILVNGSMWAREHAWMAYPLEATVGYDVYHTEAQNAIHEIRDNGEMGSYYDTASGEMRPYYRVDKQYFARDEDSGSMNLTTANDSLVQRYNGLTSYFSMANGSLQRYLTEMDDRQVKYTLSYKGMDDRAKLLTLASVKYYLLLEDGGAPEFIPYDFVFDENIDGVDILRNTQALPLGFIYTKQVDRAVYDSLSALGRQEAVFQGAVVGEPTTELLDTGESRPIPERPRSEPVNVPVIEPDTSAVKTLPWDVVKTDGVELDAEKGTIEARKNSTITLGITERFSDSELYVQLDGLGFSQEEVAEEKRIGFLQIFYSADNGVEKSEQWEVPDSNQYFGNRSQLVNLGYRAKGAKTITIRFPAQTSLSYSSLTVFAVSMAAYDGQARTLAENSLTNIEIRPNTISGKTDCGENGVLYLSVPYSTGWKVEVDGEEAQVLKVNTGFIGVELDPGPHTIEFRYMTPLLPQGMILSAIGIVLCGLLISKERIRRVLQKKGHPRTDGLEITMSKESK